MDARYFPLFRDGVPVYGLCKDPNNNNVMMTSCYSLNAGPVFKINYMPS